eukprot:TRINITY_DN9723_c0_g1_i1.p1 TRINITY_DN9723_c0_g1~~TRINITY_DN9723_c0_g1_i1.p1  ORF type:complete len:184 (-),score=48.62 TRINITY_DN9723_c0_g1_i1:117-668(-)
MLKSDVPSAEGEQDKPPLPSPGGKLGSRRESVGSSVDGNFQYEEDTIFGSAVVSDTQATIEMMKKRILQDLVSPKAVNAANDAYLREMLGHEKADMLESHEVQLRKYLRWEDALPHHNRKFRHAASKLASARSLGLKGANAQQAEAEDPGPSSSESRPPQAPEAEDDDGDDDSDSDSEDSSSK